MYINGLPLSVSSNIDLFADDSVLHCQNVTWNDGIQFQESLDQVGEWCNISLVQMKTEKCRILHVTKHKSPLIYEYSLGNTS